MDSENPEDAELYDLFEKHVFGDSGQASLLQIEERAKSWASQHAFSVKKQDIRYSRKDPKKLIGRAWRCSHKGNRCTWRFWAVKTDSDLFRSSKACLVHNHSRDLAAVREYRKKNGFLPDEETEIWHGVGVGMKKDAIAKMLSIRFARSISRKDVCNYLKQSGRIDYWDDANVLVKKLRQKRSEDATFYFDVDVNEDGVLNRVFFCPAECYHDLHKFGNVIGMDATYKTNQFRLPLVTIVGEDNEGRTKALAYAFVTFEASDDYLWVLECLKVCLRTLEPTLFITDGDMAMINAVAHQFPSSKHFRCLWHLNENLTKSMSSKLGDSFSSFMVDIRRIQSEGSKKYAEEMKNVVEEKYNLASDHYMSKIFSSMDNWCEAFLPMRFCGRLGTTSPNESHHHRLKKELSTTQSLCSCFDKLLTMKKEEKNIPRRNRPQRYPFLWRKSMSSLLHELLDKEVMDSYSVKRLQDPHISSEMISVDHDGRKYELCLSDGTCTCHCSHRRGHPCAHVISELLKRDLGDSIQSFCSPHWEKQGGRGALISQARTTSSCVERYERRQPQPLDSMDLHYDNLLKACKRLLDFTSHPNFMEAIHTALRGISSAMRMVSTESDDGGRVCHTFTHETAIKSPALPRRRRGTDSKRLKPGFERTRRKPKKASKRVKLTEPPAALGSPSILISSSEEEHSSVSSISDGGNPVVREKKDDIHKRIGKRKRIPKHFGDEWIEE